MYKIVVLLVLLSSCSPAWEKMTSKYNFQPSTTKPDYLQFAYWAAHPWKNDPADSVPKPLRRDYRADSTADIFFLHPTTYTEPLKQQGMNAAIADAYTNAKTDYTTILLQASIFNAAGRVFAPRYRQAHISAYFPVSKDDSIAAQTAFDTAYADIRQAFLTYVEVYNQGRPIIIASHSQGTTHAKRLLKEFFDGKLLQNKLVAAYLIGIPVATNDFSKIPACTIPNQTGCVVSWRTYKEGHVPEYIAKEPFKAIVTNPLSWDTITANIPRTLNKGGVLTNFNKVIPAVANAHVRDQILWIDKPRFFGSIFYTSKNYHPGDLNLYYLNIRENVQQRLSAFWK
jgi:hypothetical protein